MAAEEVGRRPIWQAGDLRIDTGRQRVERGGVVLPLPKLSFDLLCVLVRAAPDYVSNEELMARIWGEVIVSPETVTQRVKLLRDALGDDRAQPRYIEGLRGRGYRCIAAVDSETGKSAMATPAAVQVPAAPTMLPAPVSPAASADVQAAPRQERPVVWLAVAVLACALLGWLAWRDAGVRGAESEARGATVAVLPLQSLSPDSADAFIGPGLADAILNRLSRIPGLTVIARESAAIAAAEGADPRDAGRRLGAGYVVTGSTLRSGNRLRVNARLVRSGDGVQLWSQQFDRALDDILLIQDEIAAQVALTLESTVVRLQVRNAAPGPANSEAYLAYLHGRVLIGRFTVREAAAAAVEFERAIALDPNFAAALAALFDARMQLASLRRQRLDDARRQYETLLTTALRLDPSSGAAWFARAMWVEREPQAIDAAFRRGVALEPANSRGLTAYSEFLDGSKRREEGRAMLDAALRIDPLAARARFRLNQRTLADVGSGVEQYTLETLKYDPAFYPALQRYAKYRWMGHGDIAQAAAIIERAIADDPENPWGPHTAAAFYVELGDLAAARDVVRGSPVAEASTRAMLLLAEGRWREAGEAAGAPGSFVFGAPERWCVALALRDAALRSGDLQPAIALISQRYDLPAGKAWELSISNFREAQLLAHLLLVQGRAEEARARLHQTIDWIDANPKYGPVFNTRTRAQALMLLGRRDEALAALAQSFAQQDYTFWWYTIERDPTWDAVRDDARFAAIARDVRAFIATQRQSLEALRAGGTVPWRPRRT